MKRLSVFVASCTMCYGMFGACASPMTPIEEQLEPINPTFPDSEATADAEEHLSLHSNYRETLYDSAIEKNVVTDYQMESNDDADQSVLLQTAIDEVAKLGGGRLVIPKGIYRFRNVSMKSNVHILVEEGAVLKPYWSNVTVNRLGVLNVGVMLNFGSDKDADGNYQPCVNCSIRGVNGKSYVVDYSELPKGAQTQIRFIIARRTQNFLIADADIRDNYTKFCAIIFVPTTGSEVDGCPMNGEIRHCAIHKANSGYGLCQFHAAKSLYLEDIYAEGGVTFRLEPDIDSPNQGLFDLYAKNVKNERGRAGVLFQPHTIKNGTIKVDGVWTNSSSFAVLAKKGFIDDQNANNPDATIGYFANDCEVINIHAIYGIDAQVDDKEVWIMEPDDAKYAQFRNNDYNNSQSFDGPSIAVVYDETKGSYRVAYRHITSQGFTDHQTQPLYYSEIESRVKDKWTIVDNLPNATRTIKAKKKVKTRNK